LGWKITLPIRAIKVKSNGSSVYVIGEDGLVEEVEVQTGNIIGNEVEIISGLNASVSIIASTRGLSVGDKVIEE
ncbi:MAG: hypothetical protein GW939_00075, partial [Candidatus Magasanikbacteria bacterium]|nr:hypothetical protein [Candidatus Magasanikbacteria bacterium]